MKKRLKNLLPILQCALALVVLSVSAMAPTESPVAQPDQPIQSDQKTNDQLNQQTQTDQTQAPAMPSMPEAEMPKPEQGPAPDKLPTTTQETAPGMQPEAEKKAALKQEEPKSTEQPSTGMEDTAVTSQQAETTEATIATDQNTAPEVKTEKEANKDTDKDQKDQEEKKDIYLNFENADLSSFIDYIAEIKKLNVIPDKALEGSKISLTIREPLSVDGAWNVFLTILEMTGFSIIEAGPVHKIIPKDKKLLQPLPSYINVPYQSLPDSDITIRYVTFLTNIQVGDIRPVLDSMLSQPSSVHDQKDMNAFIITDKSYNVKAAAKLIHELDQMGLPESITVLRLKRVNAVDVKTLLDALIKKPEGNPLARLLGKAAEGGTEYFSPTTRIIPEERTNSLILLGNNKSIEKIVDFITKNLDTDLKEAASPLHIYELQHIDAKQVMDILKEVTATPESSTGQAAGKFGSIRGGVKYFRSMNFQVDKDGNRLIVSCVDKQDWRLLKRTLEDLDKPQPQVAVECLIVTVNADDVKEMGGMIRNKKHGQIGKNVDFQSASLTDSPSLETAKDDSTPKSLLGNLFNQIIATKGQTILTFGPYASNIWAVFHAIKQQTNASILSQPFLTIANKTSATIEVGEVRRIVYEEQQGDTPTKGYKDVPINTGLKLTPQINLDGVIRLKVEVNISEFLNQDGTSRNEKKLDTNVSVADGQVLVLGGFVKTKVTETTNKTPILGDIPVLGWFFKNQRRSLEKQYIFIFMSPTIIKPRQAPGMKLYTKMKLHQATEDIEEAIQTKRTVDPIHNWFFNPEKENYSHKVIDFANARYQPTTVDIKNDPYYRAQSSGEEDDTPPPPPQPLLSAATQQTPSIEPPPIHPGAEDVPTHATAMTTVPTDNYIPTDDLAQRRKKLKDLLAPTTTTVSPPPVSTQNKRESLKDLLAVPQTKSTQEPDNETLAIDPNKRNVLKQFLSASHTPERPSFQHQTTKRKVHA